MMKKSLPKRINLYVVLIGRRTIKEQNISLKCFRYFSNLETGDTLRGFVSYNLYATVHKPQLCSSSMAATAAAKPQATVVVQGGDRTEYEEGLLPKTLFLSPEPDEDFVDPEDAYTMPWEDQNTGGVADQHSRGAQTTYAEMIGLEVTGSIKFIAEANALISEFRDIFSSELSPERADLPSLARCRN